MSALHVGFTIDADGRRRALLHDEGAQPAPELARYRVGGQLVVGASEAQAHREAVKASKARRTR